MKFIQWPWFGTLCCVGSFPVSFKTKTLFNRWREFLTCDTSCGIVLKLHWIRYRHNLGAWFSGTVIVFYGIKKYCDSSSTVTFIFDTFLVCGLDTGSVRMVSSVVSFTAVFGMEYVSAVIGSILVTSMFSIDLSWKCEVVEVVLEGPLVTTGRCLFFYQVCVHGQFRWPCLMSNDILLEILILRGLQTYVYYFDRCHNLFFWIRPLLLKGLHKYSLNICEIFWDLKIEDVQFGEIQKLET